MNRSNRLRRPRDFAAVREARKGAGDTLLRLQLRPTELGRTRLGMVVSKRHGKAVARNRLRRRLRAAAALGLPARASADVVLTPRPAAAAAAFPELVRSIAAGWARVGAAR
ncbi:MAG: ribonuclease P protein component [Candidatus Dormibacteria bacterium]